MKFESFYISLHSVPSKCVYVHDCKFRRNSNTAALNLDNLHINLIHIYMVVALLSAMVKPNKASVPSVAPGGVRFTSFS